MSSCSTSAATRCVRWSSHTGSKNGCWAACGRLVLVIGGPYGFSDAVYARADGRLSLSRMTFSHQIVRAIFAEQIYRAFAILNHEPYHHE